jgi:hypothetical protein
MVQEKINQIRNLFDAISEIAESLEKEKVTMSLEVGTNKKTVNFENITVMSFALKAEVSKSL